MQARLTLVAHGKWVRILPRQLGTTMRWFKASVYRLPEFRIPESKKEEETQRFSPRLRLPALQWLAAAGRNSGSVFDLMPILPLELLEQVITFIDAREDLLNVALASKAMCGLVVPHHIQLRTVHCEDAYEPMWTRLLETPVFASYITTLILWGSGPAHYIYTKDAVCLGATSVPKFLDLAPKTWNAVNPSDALAPALLHMVNLHTFSWWTAIGPNPGGISAALLALASSCSLRSFDFQWAAYRPSADLNSILSPITRLRNLHEFTFRYRDGHQAIPHELSILNDITDMLVQHCPDLHALNIVVHKGSLPPANPWFFRNAHWPCLRNLVLKWRWSQNRPTDDLHGFLERHSTSLKALDWKIYDEDYRGVPIRSHLPKLPNLSVWDFRQISETAHFPSLRALALRVGPASLEDLVSSQPRMDRIEQVHFACGRDYMTKIGGIEDLDPWCEALANMFPNIRHLSGLTVFDDLYLPYEAASRLTDALPGLLHLELVLHSEGGLDGPWEKGREKIVIQRNNWLRRTRRARPGEIVDYSKWVV